MNLKGGKIWVRKCHCKFFCLCRFGLTITREVSTPVISLQQFWLVLPKLCSTLGFKKVTDALMSLVLSQLYYLTDNSRNMKMMKEFMLCPCSLSVMQLQTLIIIKMQ